jgi:hypothetical protein
MDGTKVSTASAVLYIGMQLLGAWLAYYLYLRFVNNRVAASRWSLHQPHSDRRSCWYGHLRLWRRFQPSTKYSTTAVAAFTGLSYMLGIIAASSATVVCSALRWHLAIVRAWVWGSYVLGPVLGAIC